MFGLFFPFEQEQFPVGELHGGQHGVFGEGVAEGIEGSFVVVQASLEEAERCPRAIRGGVGLGERFEDVPGRRSLVGGEKDLAQAELETDVVGLQAERRFEGELGRLPIRRLHRCFRHQLQSVRVVGLPVHRLAHELEGGRRISFFEETIGAKDQIRNGVGVLEALGAEARAMREAQAVGLFGAPEEAENFDLERNQTTVTGVSCDQSIDVDQRAFEVGILSDPVADAADRGLEIR